MTESEQRQAVIDEAISWLRTPHHNGASIKGVGVDCGQLPLRIYEACGLIPPTATARYSPQFHMNKTEEWYLKYCQQLGRELEPGIIPQKADFAIYKVGHIFSHGAIVIEWPRIIHSDMKSGGVCYDLGDRGWMAQNKNGTPRPVKFFTLW